MMMMTVNELHRIASQNTYTSGWCSSLIDLCRVIIVRYSISYTIWVYARKLNVKRAFISTATCSQINLETFNWFLSLYHSNDFGPLHVLHRIISAIFDIIHTPRLIFSRNKHHFFLHSLVFLVLERNILSSSQKIYVDLLNKRRSTTN